MPSVRKQCIQLAAPVGEGTRSGQRCREILPLCGDAQNIEVFFIGRTVCLRRQPQICGECLPALLCCDKYILHLLYSGGKCLPLTRRVVRAAVAFQRRIAPSAQFLVSGFDTVEEFEICGMCCGACRFGKFRRQIEPALCIAERIPFCDSVVEGDADILRLVQGAEDSVKLHAAAFQIICGRLVFLRGFDPADIQCVLELIQNGTFLRLVGMEL